MRRSPCARASALFGLLTVMSVASEAVLAEGDPPASDASVDRRAATNPPEVAAWLSAHGFPFDTVEAESGLDDLDPLRSMIGDARIVALGEPTHGTREAFQMKHRLLEYLVERMGFSIFAIEANQPECEPLNDYVLGRDDGTRGVEELIRGMYFWTWSTEEVRAMVEWMRRFNLANAACGDARRVQFAGFDMQTHTVALSNARRFAEAHAPDLVGRIDAAGSALQQSTLAARGGRSGQGFGVATASFPVEQARGRTATLSGWIRTEDLVDGWAGLWWRNDGPQDEMLGFDNMQRRGPRGTTDWARFELSMPVPPETVNINFGVVMPGQGRAWFDDLRVELDGVVHPVDPAFDLTFDGPEIVGFTRSTTRGVRSQPWPYSATLDAEIKHGGASSLRLASTADAATAQEQAKRGEASRAAATAATAELLEAMRGRRAELVAAAGEDTAERAIHNAEILDQCARMFAVPIFGGGSVVRDESMAANVAWLLQRNPGARIVLWAHNGHVHRSPKAMGGFLAKRFPDEMVVVGFTTTSGRYTAVGDGALTDHPLKPPGPATIEHRLSAHGAPRFILDVRSAAADDPGSSWLAGFAGMRSIGALAAEVQFAPTRIADEYDLIVHLEETTAARQLARE